MIKINLIPYREEQKKIDTRRQIITLAATFVILVMIVGIFHGYMMMSLSALDKNVRNSRAELDRLRMITGDIDKYRQDKALVEKKLQVINDLEKNRGEGYRLLDEISIRVPEGRLWITLLSKRDATIRIEGMARSNEILALFMENLEMSPIIEAVDLVASRRVPYAGTELKNFALSAKIKQGVSNGNNR
ncbi:MAG: PilN domain-containing protein [Syntrophales bacterium]|nr:PilN domain-containing protein [Syntrophales bacterium]